MQSKSVIEVKFRGTAKRELGKEKIRHVWGHKGFFYITPTVYSQIIMYYNWHLVSVYVADGVCFYLCIRCTACAARNICICAFCVITGYRGAFSVACVCMHARCLSVCVCIQDCYIYLSALTILNCLDLCFWRFGAQKSPIIIKMVIALQAVTVWSEYVKCLIRCPSENEHSKSTFEHLIFCLWMYPRSVSSV